MAAELTAAKQSQNGWPASANASELDLVDFPVNLRSGQKKIKLARAAGRSLVEMIEWWDQNIEPVTMIGGWNYREIRGYEGSGKLSNHSSGTAVDINWDKHPLAAVGTVPADKVGLLRYEATKRGLRWGGDYRNRKDEMHIEVNLTPAQFGIEQQALDVAREGSKFVRTNWKLALLALVTGGVTTGLLVRSALRKRRRARRLLQVKS